MALCGFQFGDQYGRRMLSESSLTAFVFDLYVVSRSLQKKSRFRLYDQMLLECQRRVQRLMPIRVGFVEQSQDLPDIEFVIQRFGRADIRFYL